MEKSPEKVFRDDFDFEKQFDLVQQVPLVCVSGLCLFSAPKVCEPDLAIPAMAPSIGAMSTTNHVSMTAFEVPDSAASDSG